MDALQANPQPLSIPGPKNRHLLLISLITLTLLSVATTTFLLVRNNTATNPLSSNAKQQSLISGTFNINGVIPTGATIVLTRTDIATGTKTTIPQNFPAADQGTWSFDSVTAGKTYTVSANVVVGGQTIATSDSIEVTAPADEETIVFNLPTAKPSGTAIISGNIHVDGYIPTGATIAIKGRMLGKTQFTTIGSNLPGTTSQFMSYTSAIAGQTYEIIGTLLDSSGNQIGSSSVLEITAPALNETLTINSQATPPATPTLQPTATPVPVTTTQAPTVTQVPTPTPTPVMLSGSIDFNGIAPPNSRVVILQRVYNTQQYQVAVNNVTPIDGTTWQWSGAKLATWYDIVAVLKQTQPNGTDKDIALSQTQSIAAPASNVLLTINSGLVLSPPNGPITTSCGNLSGATWNGQVSYASVGGAQSYWLEVGSSNGSNDVFNAMQNTNNQSTQTANVSLNNGTTYYARYAYANSLNAGQPQYSPFSSTTQFRCSQ